MEITDIDDEKTSVSSESSEDTVTRVNKWYKQAREHSEAWRKEARECFNYVAGDQWSDDDKEKLRKEKRPPVTFNWIGPMISVVLGIEANQRNEVRFSPRESKDTLITDALNLYGKYMRDFSSIDQEEAETFEDCVISGMGWSDTFMDYDDDFDGVFKQASTSCLDMYWDPSARKRNLVDRRWHIHAKKMHKDVIRERWPDAELDLDSPEDTYSTEPHIVDPELTYTKEILENEKDRPGEYLVLRAQWYEKEAVYRIQDTDTGEVAELTVSMFNDIKSVVEAKNASYVKQFRKVYYEAFVVGRELLEQKKAPSQKAFTFNCMTGKRDKIKNIWYGIVRSMIDPQSWSNKFFSQIMDIIQSNSKGGLLAEQNAFLDANKAEEDWAKADSIIYLRQGGLGQVQPKPVAQYPQGLDKLMNFSISSIRGVSGINLEVLGLAEREQAGVLEQMRKTSAYTILSSVFDALQSYRKTAGFLMIDFIKNYVPLNRITAVLSDDMKPMASQLKNVSIQMTDVIVTEGAASENNKVMVWSFFGQLLPMLLKMGIPIPPEVLDYSPLPATLADKWKQMIGPMLSGMSQKQKPQQQQKPPKPGGMPTNMQQG